MMILVYCPIFGSRYFWLPQPGERVVKKKINK